MKLMKPALTITASLLLATAPVARAQNYTLTDIGPGIAYGINSSGQIAGHGEGRAFIYSAGTLTNFSPNDFNNYLGTAINASGMVAGYKYAAQAFVYVGGTFTYLGALPGGSISQAYGINTAGQIAGHSYVESGDSVGWHGFIYANGTMTDIGSVSEVRGINDSGHVVGWLYNQTDLDTRAFLYTGGPLVELGTLHRRTNFVGTPYFAGQSHAYAINNAGQIVGDSSTPNGDRHAFVYQNSVMTDIGTPGTNNYSQGYGINSSGQVVGESYYQPSDGGAHGVSHAFVYKNGQIYDLNALVSDTGGLTLSAAYGINDAGQIVGYGKTARGDYRAFLLTPPLPPVPPALVTKWGSMGSADGQFNGPWGVASDKNGNIYVADVLNHRIQKFSSTGIFLAKWGTQGASDGQLFYPWGIAVDATGDVFVADTGNNRIQKFSSNGTFLAKWGTQGAADGQFQDPMNLAVDASGNVYVADSGNDRVQEFSSSGTFLTKWGTEGSGDGQFQQVNGIAMDSSSNVYVADDLNHRIQKFTSNGSFLAKWGNFGAGDGQFDRPAGVAFDGSGNIYVTDANHRVQKFSSDGTFLTKWGIQGPAEGQFDFPGGIAVDSGGNIFVVDSTNNRIQVFAYSRPVLSASRGANNLTLSWPQGFPTAILENSPTLGSGAPWTTVPTSGNSASVSISTGSQFFRLRIP